MNSQCPCSKKRNNNNNNINGGGSNNELNEYEIITHNNLENINLKKQKIKNMLNKKGQKYNKSKINKLENYNKIERFYLYALRKEELELMYNDLNKGRELFLQNFNNLKNKVAKSQNKKAKAMLLLLSTNILNNIKEIYRNNSSATNFNTKKKLLDKKIKIMKDIIHQFIVTKNEIDKVLSSNNNNNKQNGGINDFNNNNNNILQQLHNMSSNELNEAIRQLNIELRNSFNQVSFNNNFNILINNSNNKQELIENYLALLNIDLDNQNQLNKAKRYLNNMNNLEIQDLIKSKLIEMIFELKLLNDNNKFKNINMKTIIRKNTDELNSLTTEMINKLIQ